MPKLWHDTISAHRDAVRSATLDTAADLVARHGLRAVTMSQIAEETGIGRATLYKYFPDIEAILVAWHERQIGGHLARLAEIRDRAGTPWQRLVVVLEAYAGFQHEHHGSHVATLEHGADHVARVREHLVTFVGDLVREGAAAGEVRADVAPGELARYCLAALDAAADLASKAAVQRLIEVTTSGLRPPVRSDHSHLDRRIAPARP